MQGEEGRSALRGWLPTRRHDQVSVLNAVLWHRQSTVVFSNKLHNLVVFLFGVRQIPLCEQLPHENTECPDVAGCREFSRQERLRWHPSYGIENVVHLVVSFWVQHRAEAEIGYHDKTVVTDDAVS